MYVSFQAPCSEAGDLVLHEEFSGETTRTIERCCSDLRESNTSGRQDRQWEAIRTRLDRTRTFQLLKSECSIAKGFASFTAIVLYVSPKRET